MSFSFKELIRPDECVSEVDAQVVHLHLVFNLESHIQNSNDNLERFSRAGGKTVLEVDFLSYNQTNI